jgi:hypothetical protein
MKQNIIKKNWIILVWISVLLLRVTGLFSQIMVSDRLPVCDNYLHIRGESNINQFSFFFNSVPRSIPNDDSSGDTMVISIPIKEFEAGNTMMYKDFLDLMKENEYPWISVSFSRKQLGSALREKSEPCPEVRITIAGISKTYVIDCMVEKCSGNYYLKGNEIIKLSDFKLKPPARLLGLVKVKNEIDVTFGFIITFTENSKLSATL